MLKAISDFFASNLGNDQVEDQALTQDQLHLATAALLIEVASADHNIGEDELEKIKSILVSRYGLNKQQLSEITELAYQEQDDATSLYQFTQLLNEHCQPDDKFKVIQSMWEVAFADGDIDKFEEHLIRKVAELIYLSHSDFIRAKQLAREC